MDKFLQNALRKTIVNEKNSFDYYRQAGRMVRDRSVRHLFELLADEQIAHLYIFHTIYAGREFGRDLQSLLKRPLSIQSRASCKSILDNPDSASREQRALEIALWEELECINHYSALVGASPAPTLKWIFKQALADTRRHYQVVQDEYIRYMGILDTAHDGRKYTAQRGAA